MAGSMARGVILVGLSLFATFAQAARHPDYLSGAFIHNAGQYRRDITYVTSLPTHQIHVLRDGRVLHSLPLARKGARVSTAWVVVESLDGAVPLLADPNRLTTFESAAGQALEWHEAWPGIDMRLQIVNGKTERVFRVAPGADPAQIAMSFEGVWFEADGSGGLSGLAGPGTISLSAPIAFQETGRGRLPVAVHYSVRQGGASKGGSRVSFHVGEYDRNLPLIIDPLLQSTYIGYGGQGAVSSMAVDPGTGDIVVSGYMGTGVPGAAGGFQFVDGASQAYVARVDSKLQRVIQATYFATVSQTLVSRVAIHPSSGEIYVAGFTTSGAFPGGGGGAVPSPGGLREDGFVVRFSADLRRLLQTTYTGQSGQFIRPRDMAISATTGDVYVMGQGNTEPFVLRFNRQLTSQLGRFVIQGNSYSYASSIAINQTTGDVYAGGYTVSTELPKMAGGAESVFEGEGGDGLDSFIARFSSSLELLQTTYVFDVTGNQQPHVDKWSPRLAIHPTTGEVYAAGYSYNTAVPAAGGAVPTYIGGENDTAIVRFSPDLTQKRGATYFGGTGFEELGDLGFSADGSDVYITGFTFSRDLVGRDGGAFPSTRFGGAFVARFSSSLATLHQTSYFNSDGNINGSAVASHPTTGDVYIGGQSVTGIEGLPGGVQPFYDSWDNSFGSPFIARFDATLSGGIDADPDAFAFVDQFGVAIDALVTSAPVRVEGITVPVSVSVTNGEFSIEGEPFSTATRELVRGESIVVRHRSGITAARATSTVLNVGSRSDTFVSTTSSGTDSTPAPFAFPTRSPVALNIWIESAPASVSGVDVAPPISIVNGEYSIDGGAFTSLPGTVNGGQSVVVRHRSATAPATSVESQLTIGGGAATFRSITDPVDSSVHPFEFVDIINVLPNIDAISNLVVVMGINVPVPVSVVGGEWSKDAVNWTSAPGTANNFDYIFLRKRTGNTTTTVTLTVGDQSADWVLSQPPAGMDTTPDPLTFINVSGVISDAYWAFVESNEVTITGVDAPVWVNINAEYLDPVSGLWKSQGYLMNGDTTRLRAFVATVPGMSAITMGKIGTRDISWEVRSLGDDGTPDPIDLVDQTGVAANTLIESNEVTVTGVDGPIRLSIVGCEVSVNSGPFSRSTVRIANDSRFVARMTSSATAGGRVTCFVNLQNGGDNWTVTTAPAPGGGSSSTSSSSSGSSSSSSGGTSSSSSSSSSGGSSGGGSSSSGGGSAGGGGGGGSFDWLVLMGLAWLAIWRARPLVRVQLVR